MKTWRVVWSVAGFACGLAIMAGIVALVLGWENRSLRTQLAEAVTGAHERVAEQARLSAQLSQTESRLAEVQRQLEEWRAQAQARSEAAATSTSLAAGGKVHVFLQGRYVGTGRLASGSERLTEPHVYLDAPSAMGSGQTHAPAVVAVSTFSGMQWAPSWPWLWVAGWVVDESTNGPAPQLQPAVPAPPPPPAANPPAPRPSAGVVSARPAGLRGFWTSGLRPLPTTGSPRIPRLNPVAPSPQVITRTPVAGQSMATSSSRSLPLRSTQSVGGRPNFR